MRGDIDLDGDVDATDKSTISGSFSGITLGRGSLSASVVANRKGCAGYELDAAIGSKHHVRNRILAVDVGRWLTRDPMEFAANLNLYIGLDGNPITGRDPTGALACGGGSSHRAFRSTGCDGDGTSSTSWADACARAQAACLAEPSMQPPLPDCPGCDIDEIGCDPMVSPPDLGGGPSARPCKARGPKLPDAHGNYHCHFHCPPRFFYYTAWCTHCTPF